MKKTKIIKIFITIIIILILLTTLLTVGIGGYFVNYAIARKGDGGNREVIADNIIEQSSESAEAIIENNKKISKESAIKWENETNSNKVEIKAFDGITLIGEHFYNENYNVLIPSMRGCGESDGEYIGMGWLDKEDLKEWIKLICKTNPNAEIV